MLDNYRSTHGQYKNDPEISDLIMYIKYDHSCQGDLKVGDAPPEAQLVTLDNKAVNLSTLVNVSAKFGVKRESEHVNCTLRCRANSFCLSHT